MNEPSILRSQRFIPLGHFYDVLFDMEHAQKEMVLVNRSVAASIVSADPEEGLFHIEDIGEDEVVECWRINAWRDSAPRRAAAKKASSRRVYIYNLRADCIKLLARNIRRTTGIDKETSISLATTMIHKKDKHRAKLLGVDLESDAWKDLLSPL